MQHSSYSAADIVATLDGRQIIGFDEGDNVLEITPGADEGTGKVGATGSTIFSVSTDQSVTITLRLMHTSAVNRLLMQKLAQMRGGVRRPFIFTYKDVSSGEGGTGSRCFIQSAPTKAHGMNATVREWVLWSGEWKDEVPNEVQ